MTKSRADRRTPILRIPEVLPALMWPCACPSMAAGSGSLFCRSLLLRSLRNRIVE